MRGGETREVCMNTMEQCGKRGVSFFGKNAAIDFCRFFFARDFEGYTLIFHNGQAYDVYFIVKYIFSTMRRIPRVIYRGSKIVSIDNGKFRVIDSLNFLTFPLAQMPKVFGLDNIRKGTFPHFFNTEENWGYVGPMPHPSYYGVATMKEKPREEFMSWYRNQRGCTFDFKKEVLAYCEADVSILQESCNKFRQLMLDITSREEIVGKGEGGEAITKTVGIDCLQYTTLASLCMATYRYMFLTEKYLVKMDNGREVTGYLTNGYLKLIDNDGRELAEEDRERVQEMTFVSTPFAKMPSCGFAGMDAHSRSSIVWLMYESRVRGVTIQHARNGGEKIFPNATMDGHFKVDGYHVDPVTGMETAWEFMGCVYHGCPSCYTGPNGKKGVKHPHTGQSLGYLYKKTLDRLHYLRKVLHLRVHVIWECEYNSLLKSNTILRQISDNTDILPRMDPRMAFYGGRTNAVQLAYDAEGDKKVGYLDICSLYPMVLKNDVFPVGIPEVIVEPNTTDISEYFGLIQARVRPPRGLFHPVLPARINGKLFFPLCHNCANALNQDDCLCSDEERDLIGCWPSIELEEALKVGYSVIKIFEVYHFAEKAKYDRQVKSEGLFTGYVNAFLKGKQEATGWPRENMTVQEKRLYIEEYETVEGIKLSESDIAFNPGKRITFKMLLNAFWGKWGEASSHRVHQVVEKGPDILKLLTNVSISLKDINIIDENRAVVQYEYSKGFTPEMPHVNVFVAAFTTANARIRLFKVLHALEKRVLYFDTDSVILEYDETDSKRFIPDIGVNLGQWTSELKEGTHITRFVSSGPKSYSYVCSDGSSSTKLKGFTLNHETSQLLNFESIRNLVLFWAAPDVHHLSSDVTGNHADDDDHDYAQNLAREQPTIDVRYRKICRDKKKFLLFNREEIKKYKVTYTKRRLVKGTYSTLPYGY